MVIQTQEQLEALCEIEFLYSEPAFKSGVPCCLGRFIFTTGILVSLDETGYMYRYCYDNYADAKRAFDAWDGIGDPGGEGFIKRKG